MGTVGKVSGAAAPVKANKANTTTSERTYFETAVRNSIGSLSARGVQTARALATPEKPKRSAAAWSPQTSALRIRNDAREKDFRTFVGHATPLYASTVREAKEAEALKNAASALSRQLSLPDPFAKPGVVRELVLKLNTAVAALGPALTKEQREAYENTRQSLMDTQSNLQYRTAFRSGGRDKAQHLSTLRALTTAATKEAAARNKDAEEILGIFRKTIAGELWQDLPPEPFEDDVY